MPMTSVSLRLLAGPMPIEVWNILKGGQVTVGLSLISVILPFACSRLVSNLHALLKFMWVISKVLASWGLFVVAVDKAWMDMCQIADCFCFSDAKAIILFPS